jgi:protease PrsW
MKNAPSYSQVRPAYHRKRVVRSDLIAFAALLVFVALIVAIDTLLKPDLTGPALLLAGVVLAIVPAALWLFLFYRLDSAEPEPVHDVVKIFVVGLALASAVGIPLTDQLFRVRDWLYHDLPTTLLASVFITGAVEAFVVYASVRFFMYDDPDFDERADGVIYGTAAGLGYATALNLQFILANRGAALGPGEIYVAEVALAHAAFAGLLGYFLGKEKMQRTPVWWLPLGFVLAALLNGLFSVLTGQVENGSITIGSGGDLPGVTSLLLSGALAVAMSVLVAILIRRDVRLSEAGRTPPRDVDATVGDHQANLAVAGAFAVAMVVGALVWNGATNSTTPFDANGIRGAYPSYYTNWPDAGELIHATDDAGSGAEFVITAEPAEQSATVDTLVPALTAQRAGQASVYRVLETAPATVSGRPAIMQRYSFVDAGGLGREALELKEGIDYIIVDSARVIVITLRTTPENMQEATLLFTRFVSTLQF